VSWENRLEPDRILQIAKTKGEFHVSLRWRDEPIQRACAKLRKEGKLVGGRRHGRELIFYPAAPTPTKDTEHG
jgi:hypothetical protein